MCPHTTMYVSSFYYVSSYCYICVLILLYMCPHTAIYMFLALLYTADSGDGADAADIIILKLLLITAAEIFTAEITVCCMC